MAITLVIAIAMSVAVEGDKMKCMVSETTVIVLVKGLPLFEFFVSQESFYGLVDFWDDWFSKIFFEF